MLKPLYKDDNGIEITYYQDINSLMNNAKMSRYVIKFDNPIFEFRYKEDGILLVVCCGIPIQEYKKIKKCYLSPEGINRWNSWGPEYYHMSVEDYLKMDEYAVYSPQRGYNAHNPYSEYCKGTPDYSHTYNEFDLRKRYEEKANNAPFYIHFCDYENTSERYINGTRSIDSFIGFMKKYNIIETIKNMINSDKNILD